MNVKLLTGAGRGSTKKIVNAVLDARKNFGAELDDEELKKLCAKVYPEIGKILTEERTRIVATAGCLSRSKEPTVTDLYKKRLNFDVNKSVINNIINMGHESITDHDYLVFAIEDVSPVLEQLLIELRFVSFTIKSRREVDFSKAGYYTPDFRDKNGNLLSNNIELQRMYNEHMKYLFGSYSELLEMGLKKEDARFVLPYSFHSNIVMGCDAHVLKDLIIRFTKGRESKIAEVREFGGKLYEIMSEYVPYYKDIIDNMTVSDDDAVENYLNDSVQNYDYKLPEKVGLISAPLDADREIITTALMRFCGFTYNQAKEVYMERYANDEEEKKRIMREIFMGDKNELSQVSFRFEIPISLASLTHLSRHRTHNMMVPDFTPIRDLTSYCIPPVAREEHLRKLAEVYARNNELYLKFKEMGVTDTSLVYFYLAGTKVNFTTNMDGKTLAHISRLRACNKAQWEVRGITNQMRALVLKEAPIYGSMLGPDCEIFHVCHEGKESCGKVKAYADGKIL